MDVLGCLHYVCTPMASIFRKPTQKGRSPFWFAAYTDARGQRRQKTTKLRDRKAAQQLADKWQELADNGRRGTLTESACRQVVAELYEQSTGRPLHFYTVESWLREWTANIAGSATPRTVVRYKSVVDHFLSSLGDRGKLPLTALAIEDVRHWRDSAHADGRSAGTSNTWLQIISMPMEEARRQGHIPLNPADGVKRLAEKAREKRLAFSTEQIAALLKGTEGNDWHGMILIGALAGLRMSDAANLQWSAVDFTSGLLSVTTAKRGRKVQVPMHSTLREWLKKQPRGIGKAPVFPSLQGRKSHALSRSFSRIMAAAGIAGGASREATGKGKTMSLLSFHSTRHFFVSSLSAGGVHADIRKRLAGHTDDASHAIYSQHELASARAAIETLPALKGAK